MRNWRTMVGALCIVLAMMLGAFAGFVYARPGGVGVSPDAGTRGEDGRVGALSEPGLGLMTPEEALKAAEDASRVRSIATLQPEEIVTPEGNVLSARPVTDAEMRDAARAVGERLYETKDGTISVRGGTRAWPPGTVDAGGPYGGPATYEGGAPITFTVTANDPAIVFFRWDFNNDGAFDFPDQTGGGTIGKWTTATSVVKQFFDNYYGDIVVQGWDGVSTIVNIISGNNLNNSTTWNWTWGMFGADFRWTGSRFTAKRDITVTALGQYKYTYVLYQMVIWDWSTGTKLGECDPLKINLQWNWCTLATPVNLIGGKDYWLAQRVESTTTGRGPPVETSVARFLGAHYAFCYTTSVGGMYCWPPPGQASTSFMPTIDFQWTYTEILPDVASDTAMLEVNNVAPTVWNVQTTPSPGLEGSPTYLTAQFYDPGLDDTWEYRWTFLDGTTSGWQPIDKMNGGAKVLILHAWGPTDGPAFQTAFRTTCGSFCTKVDALDFGATGQNRVPTLAEIRGYDVIIIGTNYATPSATATGNLVADYMDAAGSTGGGVVMTQFGFYPTDTFGIGGRWQDQAYSPVGRAAYLGTASLGTIYVPGHPILDGVATFGANYRAAVYSVTTGATRVADFVGGSVAIATKENPMVSNGARAVALPFFPHSAYGATGDFMRVVANSVRWASRQPDPTVKPMPITTNPYTKFFVDDDPTTTTPQDTFGVHVEVRDDDDQKLEVHSQTQLFFNNFENTAECSWTSGTTYVWPAGWSAQPTTGWRCQYVSTFGSRGPTIQYSYNDFATSNLYTSTFDTSAYFGVRFEFNTVWRGDYAAGSSDGYIEASTDGGATWPVQVYAYHHMNPATFTGSVNTLKSFAGSANTMFRFRYVSADDWYWFVDNLRITGVEGELIIGLGAADGFVTIANVPPTVTGGFDSASRAEAQGLAFDGFSISDPALLAKTEWFAYSVNYDDGSPAPWVYTGSLAPPKYKVYIIHSLCPTGNNCVYYNDLANALLAQDDVASVNGFNFYAGGLWQAPTLSTMMQYDVLMFGINYYATGGTTWDLARRNIGDRFAQYLDAGRGGVLTFFSVHSSYSGYNVDLLGRYIDDKYGAFQGQAAGGGATQGISKVDPNHDVFDGVGTSVNTLFVSSGAMPVSVGGNNNAAGRNGVLLGRWAATNGAAIGVKELNNGARTAHFGAFAQPSGTDTPKLLRNLVGWVAGGLPSPKIPPVTHVYGDNGIYTVDFTVIDDDMGWVWDAANNVPVLALPGQESVVHKYSTVHVDNVDPTIVTDDGNGGGFGAFIAAQVCIRVSGTAGNTVSLALYTDGALTTTVSTTRMNGDPNPPTEKCGIVRVDVLAPHTYSAALTYSDPMGGSNPTWLIFSPWREPVTPGHGTITIKYDFDTAGTVNLALPTLKQDLFAKGQGAKIDFVAEAYDPGTDDLAFFWSWGTVDGVPYEVPNPSDAVYTIHVYHNDGMARTDGTLAGPQYLGFSEPYFDRPTNDVRSPLGTMNFRVRDTAVHAFTTAQLVYYVTLIVLDDDNGRGYPSLFTPNDGVDMQFFVVDLS